MQRIVWAVVPALRHCVRRVVAFTACAVDGRCMGIDVVTLVAARLAGAAPEMARAAAARDGFLNDTRASCCVLCIVHASVHVCVCRAAVCWQWRITKPPVQLPCYEREVFRLVARTISGADAGYGRPLAQESLRQLAAAEHASLVDGREGALL